MAGRTPDPNQESLLVIADQTGQMYALDFNQPDPEAGAAVNRIEQKLELINTLSYLAGAKMREGLVKAGPGIVTDRYGNEASTVVQRAEAKRVELIKQSKVSFAKATGHYALVESNGNPGETKRLTRSMFSDFLKKYYVARDHHKASFSYRKQLSSEVAALMDDPEVEVSTFNRENNLRPHAPKSSLVDSDPIDEQLPQLTTPQRLEVIATDPRARFMPKNNTEKTQVLGWLDYLDNPQHPLGINNQLREVIMHSQRPDQAKQIQRGAAWGLRALESIVWEIGDYTLDAAKQLKHIRQMQKDVQDCPAPHVTLAEELGTDHPGLAAWARHRALTELITTGDVGGLEGRDPLKASRHNLVPREFGNNTPGKRKNILNPFTRPDREDVYDDYIQSQAEKTTIGEVRGDFDSIIEDLTNEYAFMYRRLIELQSAQVTRLESERIIPVVNKIFEDLHSVEAAA